MVIYKTGLLLCLVSNGAQVLVLCCSPCTLMASLLTLSLKLRLLAIPMTVCYREKDKEDTLKHQKDIERLRIWAKKWGTRFQPFKCIMMQLMKKVLIKPTPRTPLRMLRAPNTSM